MWTINNKISEYFIEDIKQIQNSRDKSEDKYYCLENIFKDSDLVIMSKTTTDNF